MRQGAADSEEIRLEGDAAMEEERSSTAVRKLRNLFLTALKKRKGYALLAEESYSGGGGGVQLAEMEESLPEPLGSEIEPPSSGSEVQEIEIVAESSPQEADDTNNPFCSVDN